VFLMNILLISALFPPDAIEPAPYIKELARRWAQSDSIHVLTFGHHPEHVPNAVITAISKAHNGPVRLFRFLQALLTLAKTHDAVIVHNAPSTELPALIAMLFAKKARWFLLNSDKRIRYTGWRKYLHTLAQRYTTALPATLPPERPEIHPFKPLDKATSQTYERAWDKHLHELTTYVYATGR
jgi:hypothetical protein